MNNLLLDLIGMGNQCGTSGSTQTKESAGTGAKQGDFLSILTDVLSGSENQEVLVRKLKDLHESGEPGLAYVMTSISNMLLSMARVAPETMTVEGEVTPTGVATGGDTSGLTITAVPHKGMKDLNAWLEQMHYWALQGGLIDEKSEKAGNVSADGAKRSLVEEVQDESDLVKAWQEKQEKMDKLFSIFRGEPQVGAEGSKTFLDDKIERTPVQIASVMDLQQALGKKEDNPESQLIQTRDMPAMGEMLTKAMVERNALFLKALLDTGSTDHRKDSGKGINTGEDTGIETLIKPGENRGQNAVNPAFGFEGDPGGKGGEGSGPDRQTLILQAAKKYKEHVSGTGDLKANSDQETVSGLSREKSPHIPLGDPFRSSVFQVKDNNITFEKGSFTQFLTDRIEKMVEQFSSKSSPMDMVVRLKLDDRETLLVGLRQEGHKVLVDVKASNDGLASLLQAHREDISRHLQEKNIFASIFVQPDGEKNFQRQNQQGREEEESQKEPKVSFLDILETTV